jgi:phosphate transport system substrate-binding protein
VSSSRWAAVLGCSAVLALGVAACGDNNSSSSGSSGGGNLSGDLAGAGSSAQEAAQEAFIANFQDANPNVTVSYDPIGSGGGQDQFIAGGKTVFAGSDAPFDTGQIGQASSRCKPGELIQIPDYVSPIAVIYNLQGVDNLQLSPETIAQIFSQKITTWDDPAIKKDNPGVSLPSTRITPVNRSDDSGTTFNFTDYLHQAAPSDWKYPASETFPVKGGEAASQTSGVVQAVTAGDGAIGYADLSQAGSLGVAKIKVGSKFVTPTPAGAAADLEQSKLDPSLSKGKFVMAYAIDRTSTDPSTYPILLVSYLIGCTDYGDKNTNALIKGYFGYINSAAGQKAGSSNAGSAPLTSSLIKKNQPAIDAIKG